MPEHNLLQETYRLSLENNKMLRKMKRNAFWGGIIRTIVYAALLAAPIWFYLSYLAPVVNRMLDEVQQIQGTSVQAQTKFSDLENTWNQFKNKIPGMGTASTTQ
ncbi:MAG: hypothetical protein JWM46_63 [Candidatus Kaiserbacteria bacterium]|nr:hypothetical protein [Candidatus Kaiserbacteria bacterium]